jgi:hypothetical protein
MKQAEIWFHMKKVPIYEDMYKASIFLYSMLTWDHWEFQLWNETWHDSLEKREKGPHGGKWVSSMKKCIFISLANFFCTVFGEFFEVIFDCTCALADQSLYAGIIYEHYCLCPGWPCTRKSFKKVSSLCMCRECWAVKLAMYVTNCTYPYPPGRPRLDRD